MWGVENRFPGHFCVHDSRMPLRIPLPEGLGPQFSVRAGLAAGAAPGRLNGADLERPFWGVRAAAGTASDVHGLARAYSPRMRQRAFFSHLTAARLWNIPLPLELQHDLPLHVSVPDPQRAVEGRLIIGHRLQVGMLDLRMNAGLPLTSLERTVLDLAPMLDDERLLGAIDNILWWRRGAGSRATPASIADALSRYLGRRGTARFIRLLPLATPRSDSGPESAFRLRFIRAGFPVPVPNQNIYDANGQFVAMPDLQFTKYRMAFDYEGDHHRTDSQQWRKDLRRVPALEDARWHHTRLSADDLADPRYILTRTRRLLVERGWRQ